MTTFHKLCATLTTHGDDILTTLKTNGEDTLKTLTTCDEDTLKTPVTTCDYLMTGPHDVIDNPRDDIDNFEERSVSIFLSHESDDMANLV